MVYIIKLFLNYFAVHFVAAWSVFFYLCFTALLAGLWSLMSKVSMINGMLLIQIFLFVPFFLLYGREAGLSSEFIRGKENPPLYIASYVCVHFFNIGSMINLLKTHFLLEKLGYASLVSGQLYLATEAIQESFGIYAGFVQEALVMFTDLTSESYEFLEGLPLRMFYYGLLLFAMTMMLEFTREYWLSRNPLEEETYQVDWSNEAAEQEIEKENKIDLSKKPENKM